METIVRLKKGEFWKGSCPKGGSLEITCLEGALWITQESDGQDHCLNLKGFYKTSMHLPVLIEGLENNSQLSMSVSFRKHSYISLL